MAKTSGVTEFKQTEYRQGWKMAKTSCVTEFKQTEYRLG